MKIKHCCQKCGERFILFHKCKPKKENKLKLNPGRKIFNLNDKWLRRWL